ncbi:MAG: septum formation initiator family protein [Lachnospiraceae bacterium]|nr:septum formation initiator family protein [Lachnospiraceae bacterium]
MEERNRYVYGSTARELYTQPVRTPRREEEQEVVRRPKRKPKKKIDRVSVLIFAVTLAAAFFVCFSYLSKRFEATYLGNEIVKLENEVVELEKENATLSENVENSIDLGTIYQKARKELGMVSAKDNQVFYYQSKKSTQVRQHGNIPK